MSDFGPTDERLGRIAMRLPDYPLEHLRLVRMTYHLQKSLRDRTNAALKPFDLVDSSYTVLVILYGSTDETSTASDLSEAAHEKPANLTRVCDQLVERGLIERRPRAGDRRGVMISLSAHGRALVEQAIPAVHAGLMPAFAGFAPAHMAQLAGLYTRLLDNLGSPE